ncbi:PilW family protein [Acidobacteriota bacterium]
METAKKKFKAKVGSPKGLSYIEILIAVAISALLIVALLSLFMTNQKDFINQGAKAEAINDSRSALTWMTRDIRQAIQVVPTLYSTGNSYATSSNVLVLQMPSVDPATGNIIDIDAIFDYIIYRQNPERPNVLERIEIPNSSDSKTKILADFVESFQLRYWTSGSPGTLPVETTLYGDSASVDITLISRTRGVRNNPHNSLNTRIKLRNK